MITLEKVAKEFSLPSLSSFLDRIELVTVKDLKRYNEVWKSAVEETANTVLSRAGLFLKKAGKGYTIDLMRGFSWKDAASRIYRTMYGYFGITPDKLPKSESRLKSFVMKNWPILALDHKVFGGPSPRDIFINSFSLR